MSPLDRSASNGFRCMKLLAGALRPEEALGDIEFAPVRDYSQARPVSDEIFAAYKSFYAFDRGELEAVVESMDRYGRYDPYFPVEASQVPMFRFLGTPAQHKRHRVYHASHSGLPRHEVIKETLAWLDRYLGPTNQ